MLLVAVAAYAVDATASRDPHTVVQTISFGALTPSTLGNPRSIAVPFQLTLPAGADQRGVMASAVFTFVPSAPADGGRTISAGDIGVGITAVASSEPLAITPGFAYDPATTRGERGANPYRGAEAGHATLDDLRTPRLILTAASAAAAVERPITVTLTFGIVPQFFTPGTFTITVTLTSRDPVTASSVR